MKFFNASSLRRVFVLVVAFGLLAYLFVTIDWYYLGELLTRLSPLAMLMAFGLTLALNWFRILRYQVLLERHDLSMLMFLPIGLYHNLLVRVLPFKLGEFAYPYLTHRYFHIKFEDSMSSLFGARLLELLVIMLVLITALFASGEFIEGQSDFVNFLVVLFIVSGLVGFYFVGHLARILARVLTLLAGERALVASMIASLLGLAKRFDSLHEPRIFAGGIFWSFFTYMCSFSINWILLVAVGVDISFHVLAIIVTIGMFSTAFPFSISGFGMVELGWAFGLVSLAGFTMPEATAIGLMLNGFQVLSAGLWGGAGYLALRYFAGRTTLNDHEGR